MTFYLWLIFLPFGWSLYNTISWIKNYNHVCHPDIPKILNPISPSNVIWIITQSIFLPILTRLPFGLGKWTYYSRWGWEYEDKYRTHAELGDIWMQITPANNWIYVADPEAVIEILAQRQDFQRPLQLYCEYSLINVPSCAVSERSGANQTYSHARHLWKKCRNGSHLY